MFRAPAASAGQIYLPAGGALRTPPAGRSACPAGAAATPNIDQFKVKFCLSNKLNQGSVRPSTHVDDDEDDE